MSEEVFEDTPFAGYLRNVGAEDWGIEDDDSDPPAAASDSEPASVPANSAVLSNTALRPLLLSEHGFNTRRERLRGLLRYALSQKLSPQETGDFLEQFRYATMSSDLLRELPLYTSWSAGTDERRRALLFDMRKPWTILRTHQSQLIGAGGFVAAISALLRWRAAKASMSEKEQIALVLGMLALLYLFATARRRLLRSLREKALVYMEEFIETSKQFDGDVVRALRALQELEIVSLGYAPCGKPSQKYRESRILGQRMRAVLGSSLHLIAEAYVDAVKDCAGMGSPVEIEQFLEMFGVRDQQLELGFEFSGSRVGYAVPVLPNEARLCHISELKQALRKVHLARRVFLCCTLAVPSSGECRPAELETWTVLTDHLLNCSQLVRQLSNVITKERLAPLTSDSERKLSQESSRPNSRTLIDLASTVRHLNARLEMLQTTALDDDDFERHESAISLELSNLNDEWQKICAQRDKRRPSTSTSSPTVVATPQSVDMSTFATFAPPDLTDSATEITDDSVQPTVWESVVPTSLLPSKSHLSREERIRQMQESRILQHQRKPSFDPRSSLVSELDNVFRHRPKGSRS